MLIYFVGLPGRDPEIHPSSVSWVPEYLPRGGWAFKRGDRIIEVDGHKVSSWEDVQTDTILARSDLLPVVVERNGMPKTAII